jgi:hypothetical protein
MGTGVEPGGAAPDPVASPTVDAPSDGIAAWVRPTLSALRGLGIGVAATGLGALTAYLIVTYLPSHPTCDEAGCFPDLGPLIFASAALPFVILAVGPWLALLLRAPWPGLYAVPTIWVLFVVCNGSGPADQQQWPFDDLAASLTVLLIQYCVIGAIGPYLPHRRGVVRVPVRHD